VALATLGETLHKLTLRIVGALIGGALAGACFVFVQPVLIDVGDLAIVVAIVAFACAWIASSSERLSYAGVQIAFAFYLGFFQGFGPPSGQRFVAGASEFTVLRDRLVGILLGNLIVTCVFSVLWPTSAVTEGRRAVARALASLGSAAGGAGSVAVLKSVVEARHFLGLAVFERRAHDDVPVAFATLRSALERLAGAVFVLQSGPRDEAVERWFAESAAHVASGAGLPALAPGAPPSETSAAIRDEIEVLRAP
jgi:multidrug resistance protein MdtO